MTAINQTTSFFGLFWWCFIPIYICASVRLHCSEITTKTEVIMLDLELIDLEQQVTFSEMQRKRKDSNKLSLYRDRHSYENTEMTYSSE